MPTDIHKDVVHSSSKFQQSHDMLRRMAERALGKPISVFSAVELGGGMSNAVYRMEADGVKLVAKIAPDPNVVLMRHERDGLLHEANILQTFQEKLHIPAPKLLHLDASCELCPAPYFIMSFVEGTHLLTLNPKPSPQEIAEIKRQVGVITREICSLPAPCFGIPPMAETHRGNNCDFVLTLFKLLLQDAADRGLTLPGISPVELLTLIEANRDALNDGVEPRYIHTDTWDGNLMIRDNELVGLIDFAAVLYGDPLMSHDFHDFGDLRPEFLEGYGKSTLTHNERVRIAIYKIWQRLGMIVERGFRHYDDPNQYAWVYGEFTKALEEMKTLNAIPVG